MKRNEALGSGSCFQRTQKTRQPEWSIKNADFGSRGSDLNVKGRGGVEMRMMIKGGCRESATSVRNPSLGMGVGPHDCGRFV